MDLEKTLGTIRGAISVKRVFGEPIERDGATVIPAALVAGGGGAGGGTKEGEDGSGGGFGGFARPVGAYVIRDKEVSWKPAVDVTWIALALISALGYILVRSFRNRD